MSQFDVFSIGPSSIDVYVPYSQRPAEYTYLDDGIRMGIGGGATITAIALARLGMSTAVAGSIGIYSGSIRNMLERRGVISFLKRYPVETAITVIDHYSNGRKRPRANIKSNTFYTQRDLEDNFKHVSESRLVLRTGYPWMPQIAGEPTVKLFEHAKQHNVITALDMSNPVSWEKGLLEGLVSDVLPKTDLLCANERELYVLARREDEPKIPKSDVEAHMTPNRAYKYARRLLDKGVKTVNLHYGPRGTMIITNGSRLWSLSQPREQPLTSATLLRPRSYLSEPVKIPV